MRRFRIPLKRVVAGGANACGRTANRSAHWRNKTRIGPLPPRQAPSHDSSVNRRHLRFNSGIVRRAGWPTIDFGSKANAIALPPSPQAPLFIFRDAIHEAADRIERRAPEEYRGGDREVELFDVALVLKREHA